MSIARKKKQSRVRKRERELTHSRAEEELLVCSSPQMVNPRQVGTGGAGLLRKNHKFATTSIYMKTVEKKQRGENSTGE